MSKRRALLAGGLFLAALAFAIVPFTFRTRLPAPSRPAYGPGSNNFVKYKPGERVPVTITGPRSVRGLRHIVSIEGRISLPDNRTLRVPLDATSGGSDWNDTIVVEKPYITAPITILTLAGPLPDDPRLTGRQLTLTIEARVAYPQQVSETTFQNRAETIFEPIPLTFYAAGEYEALERSKEAESEAQLAFTRHLNFRRGILWSAAAVAALAALVVLFLPHSRRPK